MELPQSLEIRTLLTTISFSEQTGTTNPLNGVDPGDDTAPTLGDLDGDGDPDLVSGEGDGTFNYYKNVGTATAPVFALQTGTNNPLNGHDAGQYSKPTLGDLDGDGDLDLIAGELGGYFKFYRNTGTAISPVFVLQTGANNPLNGQYPGLSSSPTLTDLDGDGDLDLISGRFEGSFNYYRNIGTATTPVFALQTGVNSPLNAIDVNGTATNGYSSATLGDLDWDGDLDLIAGALNGTFKFYRNTGTTLAAVFTEQTGVNNPLNGFDVNGISANGFSTPALGDLDGDGDLDLISGEQEGVLNYHRNTSPPTEKLGFIPKTGAANPLNGVDLGNASVPALGDLDGDGDSDLIVGADAGTFFYFKNIGTASAPVFVQQVGTNNPLNGYDVGSYSVPALADLDADGDLDLMSGKSDGTFNYYKNTGTATTPYFVLQAGTNNPLSGADEGGFSAPIFADLEGDGDLDLITGSENGTFSYYRNIGTATAPIFALLIGPINPLWEQDVGQYSIPLLGDLDGDGDLDVIAGSLSGFFSYYRNTGTATTPAFVLQSAANNPLDAQGVGSFSAPALGDLDGDGDLDFVAGRNDGSLNYFQLNRGPDSVTLSNINVAENSSVGSVVGIFSTSDPDSGSSFTYTLVSGTGGTDNSSFTIVGNQLKTAALFDVNTKSNYSIRVRTTDQGNLTLEKVFAVSITNVNDAPVLIAGFFPGLPDWWRKSATNAGDTVVNIIGSVAPETLITDQDFSAKVGFAVVDVANPNGSWEYSIDEGVTWNSLADTSMTSARLLNEAAKLRFVPLKRKFHGEVALTFVAWDQSTGTNGGTANVTTRGGTTAFSNQTSQVKQVVLKKKPKSSS